MFLHKLAALLFTLFTYELIDANTVDTFWDHGRAAGTTEGHMGPWIRTGLITEGTTEGTADIIFQTPWILF